MATTRGELATLRDSNGHPRLTLRGHNGEVVSMAFSLDGKQLATGSRDGVVKVWDTTSGTELISLSGFNNYIAHLALSHDGRRLVEESDGEAQMFALDPHELVNIALSRVTRSLTPAECGQYFPNRNCPRYASAWRENPR